MKINKRNTQKGQVAIFFAVSFTFFVVLLLVVFNAMLLTSQKIKLQNTADIAAIAGSEIVRESVNKLNKANRDAEFEWMKHQIALLNPFAYYCLTFNVTCVAPQVCEACKKYMEAYKQCIIKGWNDQWLPCPPGFGYRKIRPEIYGEIEDIVNDTYKVAYSAAVETALMEDNLPFDILNYMKKHGGYPGSESLANTYKSYPIEYSGSATNLKEIYKMMDSDEMKELPLFTMGYGQELENESRPFVEPMFTYQKSSECCAGFPYVPCNNAPCVTKVDFDKTDALVKVVKRTEREPRFFFNIEYQPLHSFNIFNINFRKGKTKESFKDFDRFSDESDRREFYNSKELLFLDRFKLFAVSLALPVNGQMAEQFDANTIPNMLNPVTRIKKLVEEALAKFDDYDDNKLVGFARDDEIGENLNNSDFFITFKSSDYKREDLWH